MASSEYHDFMSAGVRELHRLWNEGFGPEEHERTNPAVSAGFLEIVVALGAAYVFRNQLSGLLGNLGSAVKSHAAAITSGLPAASPSSTTASSCGNVTTALNSLLAAASWANDANNGRSSNPNDRGLPHYPAGDLVGQIQALQAQAASGNCPTASQVNGLIAVNNAPYGNNSNGQGQSRYVTPL